MPPIGAKAFRYTRVTRDIRAELLAPEIPVCLGSDPMMRAAMPETPIDKDGQTLAEKDDVRAPEKRRLEAEPQPVRPKSLA